MNKFKKLINKVLQNDVRLLFLFIMKMENSNVFQCKETVLCQERSFIKRETSGTSNDNKWRQRVTTSGTTSDNK